MGSSTLKPVLSNTNKQLEEYYLNKNSDIDLSKDTTEAKKTISNMISQIKSLKENNDSDIQKLIVQKRKEQLLKKYK